MKRMRWLLAAGLMSASIGFGAQWSDAEWTGSDWSAAHWTLVGRDRHEIVFVDRASITTAGELKKARVLRSFSTVQTIGDSAFPHQSEILLYAIQCKDQRLGFEQWTLTAGEIGTGAIVWTGSIGEPVLYRDPDNPLSAGLFASVCKG